MLMKQLLLRVDDQLHARLRERAQRENRSINAIANDILAVAATVDPESPRDRLRSRAAALGMLAVRSPRAPATEAASPSGRKPVDMDHIARLTAGWGPQLDEILGEDRERP
ncbi:hypothetical protein DQ384_34225 [Sphaerisporangium album]|uniref:Antitoxin FitA-like ribbon-helix-helix domain-containing protein n=1 Tax=Sphaerisporangium album TaxID=509200 RepID=A0A367F0T8_9ACTN|nr:hypothetical protein [Sphaerisporangium album]RCG23415.1 hypothetical protein DQ384_34225 [Sphaerisporangium album]